MFKKFAFSLLAAFTLSATSALSAAEPQWQKLEGCTLMASKYRDGDSFHIMNDGKEFIFRLYFVDTPETDTRFPERIAQQAAYFGCTSDRAIKVGKEAAEFTSQTLAGKIFSIYTCWQDARGASSLPRYYGIVEIGSKDLATLLVENGFARIYGKRITRPDGTDSKAYRDELKALEVKARNAGKGGWGK